MQTEFKTLQEQVQLAILAALYAYGQAAQDRDGREYWTERRFSLMASLTLTHSEEKMLERAYEQGNQQTIAA